MAPIAGERAAASWVENLATILKKPQAEESNLRAKRNLLDIGVIGNETR